MVKFGFLAKIVAKPGKEAEVAALLQGALALAQAEEGTTAWFAHRIDASTFGIYDVFHTEAARKLHIEGEIAKALMGKADELLAVAPEILPIDVLAAKL